jgi:hypothetical protein
LIDHLSQKYKVGIDDNHMLFTMKSGLPYFTTLKKKWDNVTKSNNRIENSETI